MTTKRNRFTVSFLPLILLMNSDASALGDEIEVIKEECKKFLVVEYKDYHLSDFGDAELSAAGLKHILVSYDATMMNALGEKEAVSLSCIYVKSKRNGRIYFLTTSLDGNMKYDMRDTSDESMGNLTQGFMRYYFEVRPDPNIEKMKVELRQMIDVLLE